MTAEREKVKNGELTDEHVVVLRNLAKVAMPSFTQQPLLVYAHVE